MSNLYFVGSRFRGSKVQGFKGSRFRGSRFKVQRFRGSEVQEFRGSEVQGEERKCKLQVGATLLFDPFRDASGKKKGILLANERVCELARMMKH
jgi:hypothetical protein